VGEGGSREEPSSHHLRQRPTHTHTHTLADGSRPTHLMQCDAHMTCFAHATSRRAAIRECEGKTQGRRVSEGEGSYDLHHPLQCRRYYQPLRRCVGVHRPHTPHTCVHAQTHSRAAHSRSISIESCARKINTYWVRPTQSPHVPSHGQRSRQWHPRHHPPTSVGFQIISEKKYERNGCCNTRCRACVSSRTEVEAFSLSPSSSEGSFDPGDATFR
jgi:hypothetical protein